MKADLDSESYSSMLSLLNNLEEMEKPAPLEDAEFLKEDYWLSDTAVFQTLKKRKGGVELYLTFAYYLFPFQIIVRKINWFWDEKKAKLHGSLILRSASKDQRGTLQIPIEKLNLSTF